MCGRYDLTESPQALALYFQLAEAPEAFANPDVRPTNNAPIICLQNGQRLARPARWGLIPSWAKDEGIAQHTFNARAETLREKASFRSAFKHRRCLVPASAFYEWQTLPNQKKKQKLRFSSPQGHPLALAGLWEQWQRPASGDILHTYTVITTAPNALMAPVHNRMPAIIGEEDWEAWLDSDTENHLLLESMLAPCPDDWLQYAPA